MFTGISSKKLSSTITRQGDQLIFTAPRTTCRFTQRVMLRDVPATVTFVPDSLELRGRCPVAQFHILLPDGGLPLILEQDNVRGGLISVLRYIRGGRPLDEVHVQVLGDVLVAGFKALRRDVDALNRFKWPALWLDLPLKLRDQDFHLQVRLDTDYPVDLSPMGFLLEGLVSNELHSAVLVLRAQQIGDAMRVFVADESYLPQFIAHCLGVDVREVSQPEADDLMRQLRLLGPALELQAENNARLLRQIAAGQLKSLGSHPPEVAAIDATHFVMLNPRRRAVPNPFFQHAA